ncbi:hypothetical protein EDB83DRAFT_2515746 [Lactarius deliciosus]|nr:hypothetical protein EDB83DRAFT_2515746 [Lactarius deliciosus]
MQRTIHHKDGSLISEEDWKAMRQSAVLISCTRIETLDITPYHKYLSEKVKKGTAKKSGKSTPKKPMESTALKKTFYRHFFFKEWFTALQELESVAPLMSLCARYWKANMTLGSVLPDTQFSPHSHFFPRSILSCRDSFQCLSSSLFSVFHTPSRSFSVLHATPHSSFPVFYASPHSSGPFSAMQAGDRATDGEEDGVGNFSDTHPHSLCLNHRAHPWLPSTQDQQTSHTTRAKSAMQAGDRATDGEEGGVGNVAARQLGSLPLPPLHPTTPKHVPSSAPTTPYTPVSYKESQDLDQDDGNGNDKGNKCGDGESESDDGDDGDGDDNDDSLLATLKHDDLIAWVAAHNIEPQNKRATKKEIIKAIMGAAKSEHPSKEDVQEIIKSRQAKRNARTA